ncbi:hypothetical protein Leryth_015047 [Lithospermum erythrorhizon]|nr:hypothetical protein Leryth_015047 [Lithospermum erythrorhizon]
MLESGGKDGGPSEGEGGTVGRDIQGHMTLLSKQYLITGYTAKDLPTSLLTGSCDPYVEVKLGLMGTQADEAFPDALAWDAASLAHA